MAKTGSGPERARPQHLPASVITGSESCGGLQQLLAYKRIGDGHRSGRGSLGMLLLGYTPAGTEEPGMGVG